MKLSVIIPVYNVEHYLQRCIDSILNQSYKNIEIILINDGSTDGSGDICDEYASKHDSVKVIHNNNHGVSHARNCGLKNAGGELITFVDSDDTVDADTYEYAIGQFDENTDIVHFSYKRIKNEETTLIGNSNEIIIQDKENALESFIKGERFNGSLCNKVFKKELIKDLFLNEDLRINEDVLFCFQAFLRSNKTIFADRCFYNYFIRESSSSTNTTDELIKYRDSSYVCKFMYDNVTGNLKKYAADRLVITFFGYYRALYKKEKKSDEVVKIKKELIQMKKRKEIRGTRNTISYYMIINLPFFYCLLYKVYDRIRKPNWDVN